MRRNDMAIVKQGVVQTIVTQQGILESTHRIQQGWNDHPLITVFLKSLCRCLAPKK